MSFSFKPNFTLISPAQRIDPDKMVQQATTTLSDFSVIAFPIVAGPDVRMVGGATTTKPGAVVKVANKLGPSIIGWPGALQYFYPNCPAFPATRPQRGDPDANSFPVWEPDDFFEGANRPLKGQLRTVHIGPDGTLPIDIDNMYVTNLEPLGVTVFLHDAGLATLKLDGTLSYTGTNVPGNPFVSIPSLGTFQADLTMLQIPWPLSDKVVDTNWTYDFNDPLDADGNSLLGAPLLLEGDLFPGDPNSTSYTVNSVPVQTYDIDPSTFLSGDVLHIHFVSRSVYTSYTIDANFPQWYASGISGVGVDRQSVIWQDIPGFPLNYITQIFSGIANKHIEQVNAVLAANPNLRYQLVIVQDSNWTGMTTDNDGNPLQLLNWDGGLNLFSGVSWAKVRHEDFTDGMMPQTVITSEINDFFPPIPS